MEILRRQLFGQSPLPPFKAKVPPLAEKLMESLGKFLEVNLTDGKTRISALSEHLVRRFLGGRGLSGWLLYQRVGRHVDPLGPENPLILSCGLLTGTAAPASSRLHVGSKSPLTGLLGSSNVGGRFGSKLRSCGFQCILIRGRANVPVYLWIHDGRAEVMNAGFLWGLETWETENRLREHLDDRKLEIMTIGPAGENRVLFSSIMAGRHDTAARTGMGAVMGSKNLKAIVVIGAKNRATATPSASAAARRYIRQIKSSPYYPRYSTYGVSQSLISCNEMGTLGTRNYREVQFDDAVKISGEALHEYVTRARTCTRCPVHCKADTKITSGKLEGYEGTRPEFETVMSMGSKCGLGNTEALIYLGDLCNRMGLDTVSTGGVIALAMDLYDRGILTVEDTGGIELTWGNDQAMETLILQIASREGLGGILSQGVQRAAQIIGKGSKRFAYHVKGLELPCIDPRGLMALGLGYAVTTRGADFASVYTLPEYRWSPEKAEREFGTKQIGDRFSTEGKGHLVRRCLIVCATLDCLGLCKIPALSLIGDFDLEKEADLTDVLTGWPLDSDALFQVGERVLNLERLFNLRQGASSADDTLPDLFLQEAAGEGPGEGNKIEGLVTMVKEFYHAMRWDDAGVPAEKELKSIGLPNVKSMQPSREPQV